MMIQHLNDIMLPDLMQFYQTNAQSNGPGDVSYVPLLKTYTFICSQYELLTLSKKN